MEICRRNRAAPTAGSGIRLARFSNLISACHLWTSAGDAAGKTGGHILLGGAAPDYPPFDARWLLVPVNFFLVLLIGGPLGEEFGWRGLVLPALETRFRPFGASIILGLIWTAWHLPLFFISASAQYGLPFGWFALLTLALCLLLTWVYHGSGDSLLLVMLLHAAVNTWSGPLRISPEAAGSVSSFALVVLLTWVVALLVVASSGWVRTQKPGHT